MPDLLLRLLIGALVWFLGEKALSLLTNDDLQQILTVVLIIAIVLYVVFGSLWPLG
jgi:Na+-driven multidrug efflux pump